jgi:hypothetical protein
MYTNIFDDILSMSIALKLFGIKVTDYSVPIVFKILSKNKFVTVIHYSSIRIVTLIIE